MHEIVENAPGAVHANNVLDTETTLTPPALSLEPPAKTGGYRLPELDAIRGLAALIVIFCHFCCMWYPGVIRATTLRGELLYPLISGHESVMLFFLLSGFVLALPYLRGSSQSYTTFALRRIVRIYCPYFFALLLAVGCNEIWHGHLGLGSWADHTWYDRVSWIQVGRNMLMLGGTDGARYNTAFWSLNYEMRISILFPALVFFVRKLHPLAALAVAGGCSLLVQFTSAQSSSAFEVMSTVQYIGIFICGILLAMYLAPLGAWFRTLSKPSKVVFGIICFIAFDFSQLVVRGPFPGVWRIADWPLVAGAAGLILIGLESGAARSVLNSLVPRFLGRISYSLYLIHGTVLFALTFLLHEKVSAAAVFVVYVPAALMLATVFCLCIEEPLTRVSRRIRRP